MPSRKYIPYSVCLKLHNGALKKEEDTNAERRPAYRKRDHKSVYACNAAGKRAKEQAVEEELRDMVTESSTLRKKVIYPAVGHDGPYQIVLANITQAWFEVASPDPKKVVERQHGYLASSIDKLELERVGKSGKDKAKLTAAINKLEA
jgi:lipocalin